MNLWAWVIKPSVLIWHGVVAISTTQHKNSVGFNLLVVRGLCRGVAEAETTA